MTTQQEEHTPTEPPPVIEVRPLLGAGDLSEADSVPFHSVIFNDAHTDFASFQEGYVRHYIALADTKAGVIFTFVAGIIGYHLVNKGFLESISSPSFTIGYCVPAFALLLLGVVGTLAFLVIAPRLAAPSHEGFVFFAAVASRRSSEQYVREVSALTIKELTSARLRARFKSS